ncbi:hypothetical protein AC630_32925 [Bradyrhizobium sp. AS23.2]|nr:hypothetical protein AC630_32925 [Bradyrhizobium sp. AS23.2]
MHLASLGVAFAYALATYSVIASAAKQSRIFPPRQYGLLRCARNDEYEARSRLTLAVIARLDRAIQYSETSVVY